MPNSYKAALMDSIECKRKKSIVLREINYAITRKNVSDVCPKFIFMASISATRMRSIICTCCGNYIELKNNKQNKCERNDGIYCNDLHHHNKIYRFLEIKKINEQLTYYQCTKQEYLLHRASIRMVIYKHPQLKPLFDVFSDWLGIRHEYNAFYY